jgi:hypothetical protein
MKARQLMIAAATALAMGSAQSALIGFSADSVNDAGFFEGASDTFTAAAALVNTVNGTTVPLLLEALETGVNWGIFDLTIASASDADRSGTATASLGGLGGTLVSFVDNDPGNASLLAGWTYTFHFTGLLPGGTTTTLTMGGFGSGGGADRAAIATLVATAVPEPGQTGMMLAGLGVLGLLARRRTLN